MTRITNHRKDSVMNRTMLFLLTLSLIFPIAVQAVAVESRDVFLRDKVTKEIKSKCSEIMGKHGAAPSYECKDERMNQWVVVDLGTTWSVIPVEKKCVKDKMTDSIVMTEILEYRDIDKSVQYFRVDEKGGTVAVDLKPAWEVVGHGDPKCKPLNFNADVIKNVDFEIATDLEKSAEKGDKK